MHSTIWPPCVAGLDLGNETDKLCFSHVENLPFTFAICMPFWFLASFLSPDLLFMSLVCHTQTAPFLSLPQSGPFQTPAYHNPQRNRYTLSKKPVTKDRRLRGSVPMKRLGQASCRAGSTHFLPGAGDEEFAGGWGD